MGRAYLIIGLGSAHGDDRIGWEVVDRLQAVSIVNPARASSDPLDLVDIPADCLLLVVVDACHGAGAPGSIDRFAWPDSRLVALIGKSTHGFGLISALRLAETLGKLPRRVVVFTIEAESLEPNTVLSPQVEAAIPEVIALILGVIGGNE